MSSPSLRAVESRREVGPGGCNDLKKKRVFPASLLVVALVFSAACGKHKAQVKPPPPARPAAGPSAKKEPPPIKQVPPAAEDKSPEIAIPEPSEPQTVPAPTEAEFSPGPMIRIGLTTEAREIRIASAGSYYLTEKTAETSRQIVQGEIRIRIEQESGEDASIFRIQVGSFSRPDLARDLQSRLADAFGQPVVIRENLASSLFQVRVGAFVTQEEAQPAQKLLTESGYSDAFIVKDAAPATSGSSALALRGQNNIFLLSKAGFLLQPSSRSAFVLVDGKPYRGLLDVFLNNSGRITVVNQLGIEDYLLGVVPAEISPTTYPEFDGLAALAVAARTYALHEMGKFKSEGFDLTDDVRTQVYEGVSREKDATTQAVRRTAGLAIYYQDKVIDAMYMSTCGGRTEDSSKVYDSGNVPYLKSVFCAVESGPEKGETVLWGRHDLRDAFLADDGRVANRNLEFARILGISRQDEALSADYLSAPATQNQIIQWVEAAGKVAQKHSGFIGPIPELRTRGGFFQYATEALFSAAEIRRRISSRDVAYFMGNLKDGATVPEPARFALSYLIQKGLWRPNADNTVRPDDPVRRGDALFLLLDWIESIRPELLRKGSLVSSDPIGEAAEEISSIRVKWGNSTREFRFSQDPYLFRLDPGRTTPVDSLRVIGNEKLSFHVDPEGLIDFLEVELSPTGASSDRYSPVSSWNTTLGRSAIAEKLRGIAGNIGTFRDLKPHQTGESGRAVQIQVVGSRSSVVLNGYKVRNALGLRDTLFTITRAHNPDGTIASFTFHGRGYGHGVGLCQVGAFGMARAGRSYEEILKHYYQGVEIRKAY